ncbi:MAG TPA: tRNA adenosine(34) deaminase TadA [Planctomycetota bacterium]|nr:tRNA adenosine(34) deaminase TadA [Planctomycetota bacterium]
MELDAERRWMEQAIRQAELAAEAGEVPVGAVIVKDGRLLSRAHNQVEQLRDATAHAEMLAITAAAEALENWRLEGAEIYVTLEPCAMCAGAMVLSRVARIVFGANDPAAGACGSVFDIVSEPRLNHRIPVVRGVLADRCGALLKDFFRSRRAEARSPES